MQISTTATLKEAGGKSYQKFQQTAEAVAPVMMSVAAKTQETGSMLKNNLALAFGKAKTSLE